MTPIASHSVSTTPRPWGTHPGFFIVAILAALTLPILAAKGGKGKGGGGGDDGTNTSTAAVFVLEDLAPDGSANVLVSDGLGAYTDGEDHVFAQTGPDNRYFLDPFAGGRKATILRRLHLAVDAFSGLGPVLSNPYVLPDSWLRLDALTNSATLAFQDDAGQVWQVEFDAVSLTGNATDGWTFETSADGALYYMPSGGRPKDRQPQFVANVTLPFSGTITALP